MFIDFRGRGMEGGVGGETDTDIDQFPYLPQLGIEPTT